MTFGTGMNSSVVNSPFFEAGRRWQEEGDWSRAESCYRQAVAADPDAVEAWRRLGDVCLALGKPGDAVASYRAALDRQPDLVDAQTGLGVVLAQQGDPAAAEACLREVVRLLPDSAQAHSKPRPATCKRSDCGPTSPPPITWTSSCAGRGSWRRQGRDRTRMMEKNRVQHGDLWMNGVSCGARDATVGAGGDCSLPTEESAGRKVKNNFRRPFRVPLPLQPGLSLQMARLTNFSPSRIWSRR